MSIVTLNFFVFLVLSTIMYYCFPAKHKWISLLVFSLVFFLLVSWKVSYYFVAGTLIAYFGAIIIQDKCMTQRTRKITLIISITAEVLLLFFLKYLNIIPNTINGFAQLFQIHTHYGPINLIAPIGISYYTLSLWGYLMDVYRTTTKAEKNYLKIMLFAGYYPCLISGPIIRYPKMKDELFCSHQFNWNNLFMGFHRVLYGLLKKMFIADTLAPSVKTIFSNPSAYSGIFLVLGVMMYAIQIYCDFSGCMDIVIGASKLYGIKLPENFHSPFFSRNLSEFWRRWHITLGLWGKDYIMYPLLMSNSFQRIGDKCKKKLGKKIGKKIPLILALFILWLFIGIWHGATYIYILAAGIIPWVFFSGSELLSDRIRNLTKKLGLKTDTFSFHLFQSVRTICIMLVVWLFALCPTFLEAPEIIRLLFVKHSQSISSFIHTGILSSLPTNQAMIKRIFLIVSLIGIGIVDYLKYKDVDVADRFNQQSVWFRYLILFGMIFILLCYGAYGPGYNPVDFIYGGF